MTATKHAVSVLSRDPARIAAASGQATADLPVPDKLRVGPPLVEVPATGPATIETYTVAYGRDGQPERSMLVLKLPDGRRTVANGDLSEVRELVTKEGVGRRGRVLPGPDGTPNRFELAATP